MTHLLRLPCQMGDCFEKVIAKPAFCYGCDKVLCRDHLDSPAHRDCREIHVTLPKWDREFEDALNNLDLDALRKELASARPGHKSQIMMPDPLAIDEECHGGLNIHIPIIFDDGVEWMLRLSGYKRDHAPFGSLFRIRNSEIITMLALQSVTSLVAGLHGCGVGGISKTKDPRCLYIIFDKMPGKPCEGIFEFNANETKIPYTIKWDFIEDYADFQIQVANLSYDSIGSLDLIDGNIVVGECIDLHGVSTASDPYFGRPFKSIRERYLDHTARVLWATQEGLMGQGRPLLIYLAHLVARDLVLNCKDMAIEEENFYIRQPDALPGQFLMQDAHITAVLDWEFANTTSKTHAFSAPEAIFGTEAGMCGDNTLTEGELMLCTAYERRGRADLADCVRNGRKYQRLEYAIGNVGLFSYDGPIATPWLVGSLDGLVKAFLGEEAGLLPDSREGWIEWATKRHSDDSGLPEVMELEGRSQLYRFDPESSSSSDRVEPLEDQSQAVEGVDVHVLLAVS